MLIRLVAVGTRMPAWVSDGYAEYARRLGQGLRLELTEIALGARGKGSDVAAARADEGRRMLARVPDGSYACALDVAGRSMSTAELARWLEQRLADGRDVALLVGGPDGLDPTCIARAEQRWSLSPLTFPHGLVRIIVAEQLYRAASLLQGHPYHRA